MKMTPNSGVTRRHFLRAGGLGLAGLAGSFGLRGLARAETPAPTPHDAHATPAPAAAATTAHTADHGGMGTVGQVDHAANQFDPHEILTDFDTGLLTEENGRAVRTWEMYAVDREFEIAPGVHFPGWVYGTPTSAASRRLGRLVGQCPGPTLRCIEGERLRVHFITPLLSTVNAVGSVSVVLLNFTPKPKSLSLIMAIVLLSINAKPSAFSANQP